MSAYLKKEKMMNDLITIIVPIYNVEKYLQRCIDSLINQTYYNIEILLINDGSKDNSLSICKKNSLKDIRIKLISQENHGLAYTRNIGIQYAAGKYIMFVDSDDYIHPQMVEILHRNLKKENAEISSCGHLEIYTNGFTDILNKKRIYKNYTPEEALQVFLFTHEIDVVCWNKLFLKSLFDNIYFPEKKLFEDHYTIYKILDKAHKIVFDSTPLYYYCKRNDSIGGNKYSTKNLQLKDAIEEECKYIISHHPAIQSDIKIGEIFWLIVLYNKMMLANQIDKKFEHNLQKKIKKHIILIIKSNHINKIKKIQFLSFFINKSLYKFLYTYYVKKYRGYK